MPTKIECCDELINPLPLTEAIDPTGEDKRNTYCPNYDACLDLAIKAHWRSWSCEECPLKNERHETGIKPFDSAHGPELKVEGEVKMKTKRGIERKCTDCPKIGPIKGRGKCPTCYNRWYAHEYMKGGPLKVRGITKNQAVPPIDKLKVEGEVSLPACPQRSRPGRLALLGRRAGLRGGRVIVDFREHRELLAALHKATKEEFRDSVEAQALWYIKKGLREAGHLEELKAES